jgi:hypothetical protein
MSVSKYPLVEEASRHCWSRNFLDVFRDYFAAHADVFYDAPEKISGEQNLEYYALFQKYLKLYENTLQDYIESLDVSVGEFFAQLVEVKNDDKITDKKLLHFTNYLLASTDYDSFYKVMVRAAKKSRKADAKLGKNNVDVSPVSPGGGDAKQAKAEGKDDGSSADASQTKGEAAASYDHKNSAGAK